MTRTLNLFGVIAPVWLLLGVTLAGSLYPGYSHYSQALSELHALGSPIQSMSPIINNYPLGILFIGFGVFVFGAIDGVGSKVSALLIVLHGIGSIVAGYFPCDLGCNPDSVSFDQAVHGAAGLVMTLSLLIAPALWISLASKVLQRRWFAWLSISCVVLQIAVMPLLVQALESGVGFGLYQRLAYGIPMVWLLVFSVVLWRHQHSDIGA